MVFLETPAIADKKRSHLPLLKQLVWDKKYYDVLFITDEPEVLGF